MTILESLFEPVLDYVLGICRIPREAKRYGSKPLQLLGIGFADFRGREKGNDWSKGAFGGFPLANDEFESLMAFAVNRGRIGSGETLSAFQGFAS